jgi:hypothetical protein
MIQLRTHPRVTQQRMARSSICAAMDNDGSVLPEVEEDVPVGMSDLLTAAVSAVNNETPDNGSEPWARGCSALPELGEQRRSRCHVELRELSHWPPRCDRSGPRLCDQPG